MKKALPLFTLLFLIGPAFVKAQCSVLFDASVVSSTSSYTINTAQPNELIMMSYDGWPSPGLGPVTVDGNPATHINTAFDNNNSGIAEVYAYAAPAAGLHSIVCTEPSYFSPYTLNHAASFYVSGCALTVANITNSDTAWRQCITGGAVKKTINTPVANCMIYCDAENNNGEGVSYPFTWTGATFLNDLHIGNGIETSEAYKTAAVAGPYTIKASNLSPPNNGCGGLALVLAVIKPCVCVLPVEILHFDCTNTGNGIQLNWSTATETNSHHFTIERSTDGRIYTDIVSMPAAGSSESKLDYTYLDNTPGSGTNYYQLKETDLDGTTQTFNISQCYFEANTTGEIYPNPSQGSFTISLRASTSYQSLIITDVLGKQVFEKQFDPNPNASTYTIDLPSACKGMFIAKLKNNDQVIAVKKLIVY